MINHNSAQFVILFGIYLTLIVVVSNTASATEMENSTSNEADWPREIWDPANSAPDLVLPLPCGGKMAFRRVETKTDDNWLSDVRFRSGMPISDTPFRDFIWDSSVAGSFTNNDQANTRFYYIGIYEVTEVQRQALEAEECDKLKKSLNPIENATWSDAVILARKFNQWLIKNHSDLIKNIGNGQGGFVRLPVEAEWEFAARGGLAVKDAELRRASLFPMDGSLEDYAHFFGADSCNGEVQDIGGLKPNPLGLYDIIGNVKEIVLEPFRLNANGRLHGQVGGSLARGGSCNTYPERLSTALREELFILDFSKGEFKKQRFTGFRFVFGSISQPTDKRLIKLEQDFERLSPFSKRDEIKKNVNDIISKINDPQASRMVKDLAAAFEAEIARRHRIEKRSIRSAIISGALMIRNYRSDYKGAMSLEKNCTISEDDVIYKNSKILCNKSRSLSARASITRSLYSELLFRVAEDVKPENLREQLEFAKDSLEGSPSGSKFAELFVCQVNDYRNTARENTNYYYDQITSNEMIACEN